MIFGGDSSKARVDVKWRSALERALGSWESVVEWADYISFLARVQKAIKSGAASKAATEMPMSAEVAEMLARCLDPTLPSGVHQTALDVYSTAFGILSDKQISKETNLWLPGLLPVVSFAAFNIKPVVLRVLDTHIVRRLERDDLTELAKPLLLALLPSLEDGENYNEIVDLIQLMRTRLSDDQLFWQSLLLCVMTAPETRLGALSYCQKYMPSLAAIPNGNDAQAPELAEAESSIRSVITPDSGLLIRGVCAGLRDSNVLVQRGWLDILVQKLPLSSFVFTEVAPAQDLQMIISSAIITTLKRDMSLNRRLWLWLLGPDPDPESDPDSYPRLKYLQTYALEPLCQVLLEQLDSAPEKCFTVAHGLMDRWELGSQVAPVLLQSVLRKCSQNPALVKQGASKFFDSIESNMVWKTTLDLLKQGDVDTVYNMATTFDINDPEMESLYTPYTILWLLLGESSYKNDALCVVLAKSLAPLSPPEKPSTGNLSRKRIEKWFDASVLANIGGGDPLKPLVDPGVLAYELLDRAKNYDLLAILLEKVSPGSLGGPVLEELMQKWTQVVISNSDAVLLMRLSPYMASNNVSRATMAIVRSTYDALSSSGIHQVELVRQLWQIHQNVGNHVVESAVARCLADATSEQAARVFAALWAHSIERSDFASMLTKPTLLFLDRYANNINSRLAFDAIVVRTGTTPKLFQLLVDRLKNDTTDNAIFAYDLEVVLNLVQNSDECRHTFLQRYFSAVSEILLSWFATSPDPDLIAYHRSLDLIKLACLDSRTPNASSWLTVFVESLVTGNTPSHSDNSSDNVIEKTEEKVTVRVKIPTLTRNPALMTFIAAILPHLADPIALGDFVAECTASVETDWDCVGYSQLLEAFLRSSNRCDYESIVKKILERLDVLEKPVIDRPITEIGDATAVAQLLGCVERCVSAAIATAGSAEQDEKDRQPREMLGQVISGVFSGIETPNDRSTMELARVAMRTVCELAVTRCCRYWEFVETVRTSSSVGLNAGSALYAQGRLKTRLRKLLGLIYTTLPDQMLGWIATQLSFEASVRLTHIFEASTSAEVLRVLVQPNPIGANGITIANILSENDRFAFIAAYVQSLELDALEDAWSLIYSSLIQISAGLGGSGVKAPPIDAALLFVSSVLCPKLDKARFTQRRKVRKEFSDAFTKLITSGLVAASAISDNTWTVVTHQIPEAIIDADKQVTIAGKILSQIALPRLIGDGTVDVLLAVVSTAPNKVWKGPVGDYFFDGGRLFELTISQALALKPAIQSWITADRDRIVEFLSKVASYGSNSVLFGWSGSQKLASENLTRLAYLFMCGGQTLPVQWPKLLNQLALIWDTGSSVVERICLVLRAMTLVAPSESATEFVAFKLQRILGQSLSTDSGVDENQLVEACKLLDLSVAVGTQNFQLCQWLFVSDSTDAIYNGNSSLSKGCGRLIDRLARAPLPVALNSSVELPVSDPTKRRPLLPARAGAGYLQAFFNSLSITLYQEKYELAELDEQYCVEWVMADMFK